jgi:RloB-like protein
MAGLEQFPFCHQKRIYCYLHRGEFVVRSRSFNRRRSVHSVGRKVVIVCEGEKTEYGYFEAIRKSMRLPTVSVAVVHAGCTDPRGIVSAAIEERKGRKQEKSWSNGDAVWAVFDGDEHKDNNPGNWNDALQLADGKDINLAISNPSFELWYLLHFQDQLAKMNRREVLVALTEHLPQYKKASILWPEPLQPLSMDAILRASNSQYEELFSV